MGNRAVITFDKNPNSASLGIYLHWNGGAESVLAFLEAADKLGVRAGDGQYELARVVQIIGNFFGGTLSIGVAKLRHLDCENHDNGTYAVSRKSGKISIRQSRDGVTGWKELDLAQVKKHPYWQPDAEGKTILDRVLEANAVAFKED